MSILFLLLRVEGKNKGSEIVRRDNRLITMGNVPSVWCGGVETTVECLWSNSLLKSTNGARNPQPEGGRSTMKQERKPNAKRNSLGRL